MATATQVEKAQTAREQAEADAAAAKAKADQDLAEAKAKELAAEQKDVSGGKYVVLVDAFVARVSKDDKRATKRYRHGEQFNPVDGVHDVDALVASKTIGKVDGKTPLRRTTALALGQAAARLAEENSPVIDLESTPFEVQSVPDENAIEPDPGNAPAE